MARDDGQDRLDKAPSPKAAREEGKRICVEMIQRVREVQGVRGVHVMAYRQEEYVSEIIQASGVLAGRRGRGAVERAASGAGGKA